ncbi:MAG: hypothetical protein C4K49_08045 [Candidatus Thorarchaeota archaeon]|nr:MAG: hypothetical protein C4K49_08045 [Candidatus Thorarchaeota archaeon]
MGLYISLVHSVGKSIKARRGTSNLTEEDQRDREGTDSVTDTFVDLTREKWTDDIHKSEYAPLHQERAF